MIDESHPTYTNLIGKIERKAQIEVMYTDFTKIRAGAALLANGGYLIVDAMDVLRQPFSWGSLKRVIKTEAVKIEDPAEFYGFSTARLWPEPIPVNWLRPSRNGARAKRNRTVASSQKSKGGTPCLCTTTNVWTAGRSRWWS